MGNFFTLARRRRRRNRIGAGGEPLRGEKLKNRYYDFPFMRTTSNTTPPIAASVVGSDRGEGGGGGGGGGWFPMPNMLSKSGNIIIPMSADDMVSIQPTEFIHRTQ